MTRNEWEFNTNHRWAAGIILAILLQALAFTFWAGRIQGTVTSLVTNVDGLRRDLSAHMNAK